MRNKLVIAILIITLLVVYYLFGMDYIKQRQEQEALTSQITDVAQALEQVPEPPPDLEQRLAAAQASLATTRGAFPTKINSTQLINTILQLADDSGVKAIPLVTGPWSVVMVGEHDYHVLPLNVAVEGSFSQLVNFISKLENGEYKTLILEKVGVTRVQEGTILASLDLAIYTQSPD